MKAAISGYNRTLSDKTECPVQLSQRQLSRDLELNPRDWRTMCKQQGLRGAVFSVLRDKAIRLRDGTIHLEINDCKDGVVLDYLVKSFSFMKDDDDLIEGDPTTNETTIRNALKLPLPFFSIGRFTLRPLDILDLSLMHQNGSIPSHINVRRWSTREPILLKCIHHLGLTRVYEMPVNPATLLLTQFALLLRLDYEATTWGANNVQQHLFELVGQCTGNHTMFVNWYIAAQAAAQQETMEYAVDKINAQIGPLLAAAEAKMAASKPEDPSPNVKEAKRINARVREALQSLSDLDGEPLRDVLTSKSALSNLFNA